MKRTIAIVLMLVCMLSLVGCNKTTVTDEAALGDLRPMVMVNGILYYDTDRESTETERPDGFDGEITTQVPRNQKPNQDNQSNFGTGYGYQLGKDDDTIELYINNKWWIYEADTANK